MTVLYMIGTDDAALFDRLREFAQGNQPVVTSVTTAAAPVAPVAAPAAPVAASVATPAAPVAAPVAPVAAPVAAPAHIDIPAEYLAVPEGWTIEHLLHAAAAYTSNPGKGGPAGLIEIIKPYCNPNTGKINMESVMPAYWPALYQLLTA